MYVERENRERERERVFWPARRLDAAPSGNKSGDLMGVTLVKIHNNKFNGNGVQAP